MKEKFNDFTGAGINIKAGELLVKEVRTGQYYLVSESDYKTCESEDEMQCEGFESTEIQDRILYTRFTPPQYKLFKRREIEAPFTRDLPSKLRLK